MSGTISGTGTTTIGYIVPIVTETITTTGYYDVVAIGAAGSATTGAGAATGGDGAEIGGTILLRTDETIQIAVGGDGKSALENEDPGGGSGTFIVGPNTTPIVIAGGGGGDHFLDPGEDAARRCRQRLHLPMPQGGMQ